MLNSPVKYWITFGKNGGKKCLIIFSMHSQSDDLMIIFIQSFIQCINVWRREDRHQSLLKWIHIFHFLMKTGHELFFNWAYILLQFIVLFIVLIVLEIKFFSLNDRHCQTSLTLLTSVPSMLMNTTPHIYTHSLYVFVQFSCYSP